MQRRLGMEQEFFVVEPDGRSSERADDLVAACRSLAEQRGLSPECYDTEWVKNILEINTPPVSDCQQLSASYYQIMVVALDAAADVGVRIFPYSAYPIHLIPAIRNEVAYHIQVRTVGHERFLNAGRCTGTHLHLEVAEGVIDTRVGVSYDAPADAKLELLNTYNLATALDPALIALSRASPFYEGQSSGMAYRTARYRGNADYGWEGVYTELPEVGQLRPYAEQVEELVELQFQRHYAWLNALEAAGVEHEQFLSEGGNLLSSSWNPVRLNAQGTVELRNIDSNLPEVVMSIARLVHRLRERVAQEGLIVTPDANTQVMVIEGDRLRVPDFETLSTQMLYAAVMEGLKNQEVEQYTQSILQIADRQTAGAELTSNECFSSDFKLTENALLEKYYPTAESLTVERGLELVLEACEELDSTVRAHTSGDSEERVH